MGICGATQEKSSCLWEPNSASGASGITKKASIGTYCSHQAIRATPNCAHFSVVGKRRRIRSYLYVILLQWCVTITGLAFHTRESIVKYSIAISLIMVAVEW